MFNIGIGELILIAVFVLIFIGPERLPKIMQQMGEVVHQLRLIVAEFNRQFADELRPLQELQGLADDLNPMRQIGNVVDPAAQPGASSASKTASSRSANTIAPPAAASTPATDPMKQLSLARRGAPASPTTDPMKRLSPVMQAAKPAPPDSSSPDSQTPAA
ncbi:MAG: hypothetical protein GXP42_19320 [Chloroflexi bacterium]|nr:hypothetical protein [Chloroflexota bacterium]